MSDAVQRHTNQDMGVDAAVSHLVDASQARKKLVDLAHGLKAMLAIPAGEVIAKLESKLAKRRKQLGG